MGQESGGQELGHEFFPGIGRHPLFAFLQDTSRSE
jgi:hypothetical protein